MSNSKCLPSVHSGLKMVTIKDNIGSSMYGLQIQGSIHSSKESIFMGLHDSPQTEHSWRNQSLVLCPCMTHYRYIAPSEVSRYLFSLIEGHCNLLSIVICRNQISRPRRNNCTRIFPRTIRGSRQYQTGGMKHIINVDPEMSKLEVRNWRRAHKVLK